MSNFFRGDEPAKVETSTIFSGMSAPYKGCPAKYKYGERLTNITTHRWRPFPTLRGYISVECCGISWTIKTNAAARLDILKTSHLYYRHSMLGRFVRYHPKLASSRLIWPFLVHWMMK